MTTDPGATLADLGEFGLVRELTARFPQGPLVHLGPGDDAALLRTPRGHVVVSTDLLVEDRHFRRSWSSATDVGHRAAAQNLADIAAMGGTATALTVALGAPGDLPVAWALGLADGIAAEAGLVGASVIGGDLTAASQVVVSITVLGQCDVAPVRRSGARPGDVVALAGRQGWAAAGLAVLARGFRSPRVLVEAQQRPQPPYAAGPAAAAAGATAMIDVSDGLVADAGHIAEDSGVRLDLSSAAFEPTEAMRSVGSALGVDPMTFFLAGGDDHALLATFPADVPLPESFRVVGAVHESDEPAVTVDGEPYEGPAGHTHF
ncbi:MAG: thiamine-phosphate kinase [Marmoricola sp.]